MFKLVILVCLAVCSQAFVIRVGQCPEVSSQRFFLKAFMRGEWFEQARYFVIFQGLTTCTTWDWTNNPDQSVTLNFGGVNLLNQELEQEYTFETSPDSPGLLEFNEGCIGLIFQNWGFFRRATFNVIGTDYNSYAVIYACEQIPFTNTNAQSLWILSRRQKGLNPLSQRRVQSILADNGIDPEPLMQVNQNGC